ncbi:MAG: class I SAM-dependent methyltransferase [Wenzhouxiangella sp.]|jgi:2-polyprenyl-3-methyl-5-hydroxy-6-metoxy-1,4-benzoquinol methylase|nr:class I SAM-dependent methyltransferase [Wenzhouxiangella sp.]
MKRIPEPELMDAPAQARAYAEADFSEPNALFVERFLGFIGSPESVSVIDLGCGPGDICIRVAQARTGWTIVGLDAGPNMLALAEQAVASAGLESVIELILARLPQELPAGHFDAIISNSLLHHLPDPQSLWQSIRELAEPGCVVQVMDLMRPDSAEAVSDIVRTHAADAPEVLRKDFYNSLCAAYTPGEVREQILQAGLDGLSITTPTDRHWLVQGRVGR